MIGSVAVRFASTSARCGAQLSRAHTPHSPRTGPELVHPLVFSVHCAVQVTVPVVPAGQLPTPSAPSHSSPASKLPLPHGFIGTQPAVLRWHCAVHVTVP